MCGELVVSGLLGIAIADTLVFMALRRLGAALLAIVDCIYAPTVILLSVMVLDVAEGQIQGVTAVANPDKLQHLGPVADLRALLRERS